MTRRWLPVVVTFAVAALAGHAAVIWATPWVMMKGAMERLAAPVGHNRWFHPPRVTEASRTVVRPSPDLAYSACVYDLSGGPLQITAAPWGDYMSVSAFAANTDNFFVANDRTAPGGVDIVLRREGQEVPGVAQRVVTSPTTRGIILQRRLAPTAERFADADAARRHDVCTPLSSLRPA